MAKKSALDFVHEHQWERLFATVEAYAIEIPDPIFGEVDPTARFSGRLILGGSGRPGQPEWQFGVSYTDGQPELKQLRASAADPDQAKAEAAELLAEFIRAALNKVIVDFSTSAVRSVLGKKVEEDF